MHEALQVFQPDVARWFENTLGEPTAIQQQGWPPLAAGSHALLAAPTGTGKTLAAFLCTLNEMLEQHKGEGVPDGLSTLYLSPLKSLTNDMGHNLMRPLRALGLEGVVRVAVRNGDTPAAERARMMKRPPHILLTTPESLYVLLTSKGGRGILNHVRTVIVDELHAILDSKRGTHLALSLERLEALCDEPIQRIGLSATVKPLSRAAHFLGGYEQGEPRDVKIIAPITHKKTVISVTSPIADMRVLPEGTIWPELCKMVFDMAKEVRTTLVFLNHRASCEKVAFGVNTLHGGQFALTHHGCVSREQRLEAEQQLKAGTLRCLCATSSMELGIDVGEVDLVLQIASPPTIAAGLQRLGRAGHSPGRESVIHLLPRTSADTLACGLIARGMGEGAIEEANIPMNCLDVLAQHLTSMASAQDWTVADMLTLARGAYPYTQLTEEEITRVLSMLYGDYEHDEDKPVQPRIMYDRLHGTVTAAKSSRLLATLSGGTIPDRGYYAVTLSDGTRLGELDEVFVFEARIGNKFMLGSFAWQIERFERDRVVVRPTTTAGASSPFWNGDWYGRPLELGKRIGRNYAEIEEQAAIGRVEQLFVQQYYMDVNASLNAARLVRDQISAIGCFATDTRLIAEHFRDESGNARLLIHCPLGGRVNLGLLMLLENSLNQQGVADVQIIQTDDGILLHSLTSAPLPKNLLQGLSAEGIPELLAELVPNNALFSMVFRYNASRALMMGFRTKGRVPLWVQRLRGDETMKRASGNPDHPLLVETLVECLHNYLDMEGIVEVVGDIVRGRIAVHEVFMDKPSPMAIELRRLFEGMMMYEEPYPERSRSSGRQDAAQQGPLIALPPQREDVDRAGEHALPTDADGVHNYLMMGGDLQAGDADIPLEWLKSLAREGRALYIEPGLWIAKEQEELYLQAFSGDNEALMRIVRRALRYRGANDVQGIAARYALEPDDAQCLIDNLVELGSIVPWEDVFVHRDVYERASGMRRASLRQSVVTAPPEGYAAYLAVQLQNGASPEDRLAEGIGHLSGFPLPYAWWEDIVLPARTMGYTPRMLDALLQTGNFTWRMDDKGALRFDAPIESEQQYLDAEYLTEEEQTVLGILRNKGALFASALIRSAPQVDLPSVLLSLARKGLITNDSYKPVRLLDRKPSEAKGRVSKRVSTMDAGRWEALSDLTPAPMEDALRRAMARWGVLCKETAQREGIAWGEALEILRTWEYTGNVRRGYFVRSLSGAQFVSNEMASRITYALSNPSPQPVCLIACDPAQAYGSILPHVEGRSFTCIPSTAVVLEGGVPVMVLEKNGGVIRAFDDKPLGALQCAIRAYMLGQIWPGKTRMVVKNPPDELRDVLLGAGFKREMMDLVLWRRA